MSVAGDGPVSGWSRWRVGTFVYTIVVLLGLMAVAITYVSQPAWFQPYFKVEWVKDVAHAIWYAMLGGCAISLKGVYDHWISKDWTSGQWELWFFGRPFSAAVVGAFTFVALQATNTSPPSIPALCVGAFILGMQERRFFAFISALATVILTVPGDTSGKLNVTAVTPDKGNPGDTLLVSGSGFAKTARLLIGGQPVDKPTISADGTSIAGLLPARAGAGMNVDLIVVNPDGTAYDLAGGFTYLN